jgi:hypothetical protein
MQHADEMLGDPALAGSAPTVGSLSETGGSSSGRLVFPKALLVAAGFALLTLILCVPSLRHRSWWIDELVTRDISQLPFYRSGFLHAERPFAHSILAYTVHDTGPGPVMYMLEGAFAQLCRPFGGEGWLRVPGILAGALTSAVLFLMLRACTGFLAAVIISTIAAAMPLLIDFYTGARGYGWLVLVSLVQWAAAMRLVAGIGARRPMLIALCAASILGLLINALHTPWTVCLGLALLVVTFAGPRSERHLRPRDLLGLMLLLVVIHAAWLGFWIHLMQHSQTGSATTVRSLAGLRIVLHRMLQQKDMLGLIALNFTLAAALVRYRDASARQQAWFGMLVSLAATLLLAALCARFFAAWRYFYILPICAMLSAAFHLHALLEVLSSRLPKTVLVVLVGIACAAVLLAQVPRALKAADKPPQDWWSAVELLHQHAAPSDLVLTGPNSEYEVYRAYAKAAGMTQQAPLIAESPEHIQFKTDTADGLRLIVNSKRPTWLITAAFGQHRTPEFWELVRDNFVPVEKIRGRNDILICRTKQPQ